MLAASLAALASLALVAAAPAPTAPHIASGGITSGGIAPTGDWTYTFRVSESGSRHGDGDRPTSGTVHVHGDQVRIDLDRTSGGSNTSGGSARDDDPGSYILVTDGGTRMQVVHPARREVEQMSAATFERIIGVSLRAVRPLVRFAVEDPVMATERVGTGGSLAGFNTEHVRMTERYTVHITAMGFDGGEERVAVVTDYWVSPGLNLGRNPLLALLENAGTAMAQSDAGFVREEQATRAELLQGTPLRTVATVTSTDKDGSTSTSVHTTEITSVRREAQPASLFEVPSGYRVKSSLSSFTL